MTDDQYRGIVTLLEQIRDALHYLCADPEPVAEPSEPGCEHPEATRTVFSTLGDEHWICGECGYEHRSSRLARV